jgi:large subunit ribosomal protein L17e
MFVLFARI